ncbi:glutamate-5-semialdehyde dehydrogenase [Sneathiella sp. P13V-1]|uniref:glutamate-5-semialdehyde dehydrogenase n=1 Tax=Sneathiella sp. P13V-1 TaxID=2697366 RepID=UPI00187B55CC|nr:glutamate-5-semialdehyde dehydrogenase [Sneathiella sp. P13V-1]MBE7636354.1 glutamate-5-semialdehyde dehydrogenase [Sneathiella sp. P13V-1]
MTVHSNITDTQSIDDVMEELGRDAKKATHILSLAPADTKNKALLEAAKSLRASRDELLAANAKDMTAAKERGTASSFLDRLKLDYDRIESMAKGLEDIAALADPVGDVMADWDRPNGLNIARVRVPLGVIGIIYESRPNVTADAGALCLKAGNACILRGGSESYHSSRAIWKCLQDGLKAANLPSAAIQMIPTTDRAAVGKLLTMPEYVDVIVPRGGRNLIERVQRESRIPVFSHLDGLVHIYLDKEADADKAVEIIRNSKLRRTGICGSLETLLIHKDVLATIGKAAIERLLSEDCEVRGDAAVQALDDRINEATEIDWQTEYLDAILSAKVVESLDEAIAHIEAYGSHHTDCILTGNAETAARFLNEVDSAIVMQNASTQFADGGEFGMGAEIGISTGKMHARGPVGVEQLTSFKYQVRGEGQTRP